MASLDQTTVTKPILIELRQAEKRRNATFRPEAYLRLTPALRESGLLLTLPGEEAKSLLLLLTFLSPNGDCIATVAQLAEAMGVSLFKARGRMQRLAQLRWQEQPLVLALRREAGFEAYAPHPQLIGYEHTQEVAADLLPPEVLSGAAPATGSRQKVIAFSRANHARPRAEAESMIEAQLGHRPLAPSRSTMFQPAQVQPNQAQPPPVQSPPAHPAVAAPASNAGLESPEPCETLAPVLASRLREIGLPQPEPEKEADMAATQRQLIETGLSEEQAVGLVQRFDLVRIRRQLAWLPYRHARNQAGFLLAAIEDNYEAPPALWQSRGGSGSATKSNSTVSTSTVSMDESPTHPSATQDGPHLSGNAIEASQRPIVPQGQDAPLISSSNQDILEEQILPLPPPF